MTISDWSPLTERFREAAAEGGALLENGQQHLSPCFWKTKPIVLHLSEAAAALPRTLVAGPAATALAALAEQKQLAERGRVRARARTILSSSLRAPLLP